MYRLLADWQDVPLRLLAENPGEVYERYDKLLKERGVASGKNAMACLRAVYNAAARRHRELQSLPNPVAGLRLKSPEPRKTAMGPDDLPEWNEQRLSLGNDVRSAYHLFMLLSAMRRSALSSARWEHLDVKGRVLHVPSPKGGSVRAFDLPLSRRMLWVLAKARKAGQKANEALAAEWIFPATCRKSKSASGHISEVKEKNGMAAGHALRHTWAAMARLAGCSDFASHKIMNHAITGVHDNYGNGDAAIWPYLLAEQEKVSAFVWKALNQPQPADSDTSPQAPQPHA